MSANQEQPGVERGAYEVLAERLAAGGRTLADAARSLNLRRAERFGATELKVTGAERLRTEHNSVARDAAALGDRLVVGYHVFMGLKSELSVNDVLQVVSLQSPGEVLADGGGLFEPKFLSEFKELHQYYKDARLASVRRGPTRLWAAFQVGRESTDQRAFRWSVDRQNRSTYLDARGERDTQLPPAHDFQWTLATRENHVKGTHPHVSVLDEVFVECVGGDLTVKVENNTASGEGIYSEPVEDPLQTLDDGRYEFARAGKLVLLKIQPYREPAPRYLVYNPLSRKVWRLDGIGDSCVQLPEDHGIVFPGGYVLETGEVRTFDLPGARLRIERVVRSPNGEDVLYGFGVVGDVDSAGPRYALCVYNLIRREMAAPIVCQGYALFDDGRLVVLRGTPEPTRVHELQIWTTPFTSAEFHASRPRGEGLLDRIGNADLVRGVSECFALARLTAEQAAAGPSVTRAVYETVAKAAQRALDAHHWVDDTEVATLAGTPLGAGIRAIRDTATVVLDEFDKVEALRRAAVGVLDTLRKDTADRLRSLRPEGWRVADDFVTALADLRRLRGRILAARDVRYLDLAGLDKLEGEVRGRFEDVSRRTAAFLAGAGALAPYLQGVEQLGARGGGATKAKECEAAAKELSALQEKLELLAELAASLGADDAVQRTAILTQTGEVFAALNRTRAGIENRRRSLGREEHTAAFQAELMLVSQSLAAAVAAADTPERAEEQRSRLLLRIEELEGRFADVPEFVEQLGLRREEASETLDRRREELLSDRRRRAEAIWSSGERLLAAIRKKAFTLGGREDLEGYFASDALVAKARELPERLRQLGDAVRGDEFEGRLTSLEAEAGRALRDKAELFEEGGAVIRLGRHRFAVNTQAFDLTLVPRGDGLAFHLAGTDYYDPVTDPEFLATRPFWDQSVASETPGPKGVYRSVTLAVAILREADAAGRLEALGAEVLEPARLLATVRAAAQNRLDEGYDRGVHDEDAAKILSALVPAWRGAGLLRFSPAARAVAQWVLARWEGAQSDERGLGAWSPSTLASVAGPPASGGAASKGHLGQRARSLARARALFGGAGPTALIPELRAEIEALVADERLPTLAQAVLDAAAEVLALQLADGKVPMSAEALELRDAFVRAAGNPPPLDEITGLGRRLEAARGWVEAFVERHAPGSAAFVPEVAVLLAAPNVPRTPNVTRLTLEISGLVGQHDRLEGGVLKGRLDELVGEAVNLLDVRMPAYRQFLAQRTALLGAERARLRLEELRPKPMSGFVRNRLLDEVYLPLIGENLAKQMGTAGGDKRTDRMGLLLLISPPGYGKTTLMEYVASRLGLVFVKVNGPALGHGVTSLDPSECAEATARQEVERINLGLEMGANAMLYLDDIQHTSPELLQKFISVSDAQRKIESVWKGRTRTVDLRGKRFVVCMAGNPYTESGELFRIPDMLANRADVHNLGDVVGGREDLFALSYLENAITQNTSLAPIASRGIEDLQVFIRKADGEEVAESALQHAWTRGEVDDIVAVLRRMRSIQRLLLEVNKAYIASASMAEANRTEPAFKLQGSYRNMAKLASRVVPVMNDQELSQLITDHYRSEAQTLATGAEANLLRLARIRGINTTEDDERWAHLCAVLARQQRTGGGDGDPASRMVGMLSDVADGLRSIHGELKDGRRGPVEPLGPHVERLAGAIGDMAVNVQVTSPPPPGVAALIDKQVQVVEQGLVPTLRATAHLMNQNQEIWQRLGELTSALGLLREQLSELPEASPSGRQGAVGRAPGPNRDTGGPSDLPPAGASPRDERDDTGS